MIKHLKLLAQWVSVLYIRRVEIITLKPELFLKINNQPRNYVYLAIENFKGVKCTHLIEMIFGVLILKVCNQNKVVRFLLCIIDLQNKYAKEVLQSKDERGITITSAFQKIFHESGYEPSEVGVDQGSEFYSRSMKLLLHEGKPAAAERFIRILKTQIYNHMTAV